MYGVEEGGSGYASRRRSLGAAVVWVLFARTSAVQCSAVGFRVWVGQRAFTPVVILSCPLFP